MNLVILIIVGLVLYITRLARPGLLFGVTVDPAFTLDERAMRIMRRYGLETALHFAIAVALGYALGPVIGMLWQIFGGLFAFVNANRATKPFASMESSITQAGTALQREDSAVGSVLALAPLVLLAALAWYAGAHQDRIPVRFPIHFSFHGPDRWVDRSPRTIYGLLLLSALLCLTMILFRYGMIYRSRRLSLSGASARAEAQFRRVILWLLIAVEYYMVALPWVILFSVGQGIQVLGIGMIILTAIAVLLLLRMGQGGARLVPGGPTSDGTPDSCWKWGMLYINPRDPALFVQKRFGIGYTINFGNRWSWILAIVLLAPLGIRFLLH